MKILTPLEAAHTAGLLDNASWNFLKRMSRGYPEYTATIRLTKTNDKNSELIAHMEKLTEKPRSEIRAFYCPQLDKDLTPRSLWQCHSRKVMLPLLSQILPYLVFKRKHAEILLSYFETVRVGNAGKLSDEVWDFRHKLFKDFQDLR
jgi:hypothetical protein